MRALAAFGPQRFLALLRADAMNVAREPVLFFNLFTGILLPVLIAVFRTQIDAFGMSQFGLAALTEFFAPFALLIPVILIGWVTGMLLLEDRDEGPLLALEVTPVGKNGFLLYRTFITFVVGVLAAVFALWLLMPDRASVWPFLAVLISMNGVLAAFLLVALASNKVEGMALSKVINLLALVPLAALLPQWVQYLAAVVPTYWIGQIYFADGITITTAVIALLSHVAVLTVLYRLIAARIG